MPYAQLKRARLNRRIEKLGVAQRIEAHFFQSTHGAANVSVIASQNGEGGCAARLGFGERFIDIAAETAAVTNFGQYPVYLGFDPAVIDESKLTERGKVGHYYREDRVPREDKAKVPKQST